MRSHPPKGRRPSEPPFRQPRKAVSRLVCHQAGMPKISGSRTDRVFRASCADGI
ncbi:hypothetical protein NEISICOT_02591 [Neisseria sicca ATCC 29256]|uniref:Uncharacterized protein n=1 Tax=Neisseria sicca ATCC 29256 TaxID=547045 RepID=C6M7S7_NEISI|nr:hypothetical protein NEISICOT_02591 [Neisseria sicca ATCC 29256]